MRDWFDRLSPASREVNREATATRQALEGAVAATQRVDPSRAEAIRRLGRAYQTLDGHYGRRS